MTRDGEIPAIFNPKRVRTPSVVVTGDSPNGPYGGFTNIINASNPQLTHSDSIGSNQPDGAESGGPIHLQQHQQQQLQHQQFQLQQQQQLQQQLQQQSNNNNNNNTDRGGVGGPGDGADTPTVDIAQTSNAHSRRLKACKESCCSELAQKMYFGVCVTILVTASWVGATHCIKFLYLNRSTYATVPQSADTGGSSSADDNNSTIFHISETTLTTTVFNAPFFASWFFTNFAFLFFPIYLLGRIAVRKCDKPREILGDVLRGFRDRGFTIGRFLNRCLTFCILWVLTTYLYALSLRALYATDVMALFATNVACVYLLSWVILHEQFVGVRIVAVILCDTGIALLAYMDGITGSPTLGGVVLAALAAAGYAVFKVMFRKVMGDPPVGQIAFTFTTLGFLNAALLWPVCVALYFTGMEVMPSDRLPWIILLIASVLLLVFHILTQFSSAITYNMFVTLGLITAVPVSGALDVVLYGAQFAGMKLAGVILIAVGFFLVMFPENWPDYITRLLRKTGRAILHYQCCCDFGEIDYDNSKYHLVGSQRESHFVEIYWWRLSVKSSQMGSRSPTRFPNGPTSNRHRLSDGLHSFPSSLAIRPCEMTDLSPTFSYHHQQQQHQQHQHQLQQHEQQHQPNYVVTATATTSGSHRSRGSGGGSSSSTFTGSGLFSSYFGSDDTNKKKTSETTFFSLGFRRKSSAYYAATD